MASKMPIGMSGVGDMLPLNVFCITFEGHFTKELFYDNPQINYVVILMRLALRCVCDNLIKVSNIMLIFNL